jgi:hypothetical protein
MSDSECDFPLDFGKHDADIKRVLKKRLFCNVIEEHKSFASVGQKEQVRLLKLALDRVADQFCEANPWLGVFQKSSRKVQSEMSHLWEKGGLSLTMSAKYLAETFGSILNCKTDRAKHPSPIRASLLKAAVITTAPAIYGNAEVTVEDAEDVELLEQLNEGVGLGHHKDIPYSSAWPGGKTRKLKPGEPEGLRWPGTTCSKTEAPIAAVDKAMLPFLEEIIKKDLSLGRLEVVSESEVECYNKVSCIWKKVGQSVRQIDDLRRSSVNWSSRVENSILLPSFDEIKKLILRCSKRGVGLLEYDVEAAFRLIPIAESEQARLCFRDPTNPDRLLTHKVLPFGHVNAPQIFVRVNGTLTRVQRRLIFHGEGGNGFVFIDDSTWAGSIKDLVKLILLATAFGFPVALEKIHFTGKGQVAKVLGYEVSFQHEHPEISLPEEKRQRLKNQLVDIAKNPLDYVSEKELQEVTGRLNFLANVNVGCKPLAQPFWQQLSLCASKGRKRLVKSKGVVEAAEKLIAQTDKTLTVKEWQQETYLMVTDACLTGLGGWLATADQESWTVLGWFRVSENDTPTQWTQMLNKRGRTGQFETGNRNIQINPRGSFFRRYDFSGALRRHERPRTT